MKRLCALVILLACSVALAVSAWKITQSFVTGAPRDSTELATKILASFLACIFLTISLRIAASMILLAASRGIGTNAVTALMPKPLMFLALAASGAASMNSQPLLAATRPPVLYPIRTIPTTTTTTTTTAEFTTTKPVASTFTTTTQLASPTTLVAAQAQINSSPKSSVDSPTESWTVKRGESFWSISESVLQAKNSASPTTAEVFAEMKKLISANQDLLVYRSNPALIYAGQQFIIPA